MRGKQYKGKLDPKSAAKGIRLANENANSLLADAKLLLENNRFERAVSLSILAIEEVGKSSIIRAILLTDDPEELKKEWQNYRKHIEKNTAWIVPELVAKGARQLEDLRPMVNPQSDHGKILDNLKQLSFYTDIFSARKWSIPKNVIDADLAKMIFSIAETMIRKDESAMTSEKELELWIKHLKPVWKQDMIKMKQALINCYHEAETLGLIEKGLTKKMIEFLI